MKHSLLLVVLLFFASLHNANAQSFEFGKDLYDTGSHSEQGISMLQLPSNEYLIASDGGIFKKSFYWRLYKTKSTGSVIFSINSPNLLYFRFVTEPQEIVELSPDSYLVHSTIIDSGSIKLVRLICDSNGKNATTLYNKYPLAALDSVEKNLAINVKYIPNECFYVYGQSPYAPNNSYVIWKIDTSGKMIWRQDYYDTCNGTNFNLTVFKNKLLLTSSIYNARITGARLLWLDLNGNVTKEGTICDPLFPTFQSIYNTQVVLPDTSIVMGFYANDWSNFPWPLVIKFNANLDTVWHQRMYFQRATKNIDPSNDATSINKMVATVDNNIGIYWSQNFFDEPYGVKDEDNLRTYSSGGNLISKIQIYDPSGITQYNDMIATSDKGYAFTGEDEVSSNQVYSYLLKLKDSLRTGIEVPIYSEGSVSIYPNPATSALTIRSAGEFKNATIKIYNLQGQEVQTYSHITGKEFLISRNNTPQGLYILQIISNNKTQMMKFVWE